MVALTDIAVATRDVPVPGGTLRIRGLSLQAIADLIARFPAIGQLTAGEDVTFDAASLMRLGPDAVAAAIAAAAGNPGDEAAERAARENLSLEVQTEIVEAILALTLPSGIGPFIARLAALMRGARAGRSVATETRAPSSPKPRASSSATSPPSST